MDANMTSREKIAAILEKSKGGRMVTSKICKYLFVTLGIGVIEKQALNVYNSMHEQAAFYEMELVLGKIVVKRLGSVQLKSIILITRSG